MITYIVYRQDTPIPTGRKLDKHGRYSDSGEYDEHEANLVALGHVTAASNDDAWKKAKRLTLKPVLEEIKE